MKYYRFKSNGDFGLLYGDELGEWTGIDDKNQPVYVDPYSIIAVLDSVKNEFEPCFGDEYVNSHPITVLPCDKNPVSLPMKSLVFLTARGTFWCQYVYQFSHELCHIMIGGVTTDQLMWLEETICELASQFFLHQLAKTWGKSPPYEKWKGYENSFTAYKKEIHNKLFLPSNTSFPEYVESMYKDLCNNPHMRNVNALIAKFMLPLFYANPDLWCDVPLISKITCYDSIKHVLIEWHNIASNKKAIGEMLTLFCD